MRRRPRAMPVPLQWLALIVALLFAGQCRAATVHLTDQSDHYRLNAASDVLEDARHALSLDDVVAGRAAAFAAESGRRSGFGITASAYWFRFTLDNAGPEPRRMLLVARTSWLESLDLYSPDARGGFSRQAFGDALPFSARPYAAPEFIIPLAIAPGSHTYYLRVASRKAVLAPLDLWTPSAFYAGDKLRTLLFGAMYGILLAATVYNLLLWFSTRDRNYLMFSLYLLAFFIMNASYRGYAFQYLWPGSPRWENLSTIQFIFLYQAMAVLFAMVFLDVKRQLPRMHRVLGGWLVVLALVWLAATLFDASSIYYCAASVYMCLISLPLVLIAGVYAWQKGYRTARFFVLGSIASLLSMTLTALTVLGLVSYDFFDLYVGEIGIVIDTVLFSLALVDHIKLLDLQRKDAESRSRTDTLTGVANRRHFEETSKNEFARARREERPLSVVLFDIDRFKEINDTRGHSAGDAVIGAVARMARKTARQTDFVARLGGDEFVILLIGAPAAAAAHFSDRLRENIAAEAVVHAGRALRCTASFGVSELASSDRGFDSVLARADQALYSAKQAGRDRVMVESGAPEPVSPRRREISA
jgi:diguanylate cyclase (GGDEF)-like protein